MTTLAETIAEGYAFEPPLVTLGAAIAADGTVVSEPKVALPLSMFNRHGLIAGATGTGKTKTLQLITEQLSAQGVPVFVADLKGDLSGLAAAATASPAIEKRLAQVGTSWEPAPCPVDFVSLTGRSGAQLRATVSDFGPLLLAKVLQLNETQTSVLTLVFKVCDDQGLPLLDFDDLRAVLRFLEGDEGKPVREEYGGMASATVGVLMRKMVELEMQGAKRFFGEPQFDVHDLLHVTGDGRGLVTCLSLSDCQERPALFSTFMMWLLAELFQTLPEAGDLPQPKLVFFFDEAHLLFRDASKAFLQQVEQVVRLIRSKGVGVFFVTQTPKDVPEEILAQLGTKVQHALRAHTPDDDAALKATVRTYPRTAHYDLEETLTTLGIGEAVVTGLDRKGVPTPVAAVRLVPPRSRMAPLTDAEMKVELAESDYAREYGEPVNRDSAYEMLARRLEQVAAPAARRGPFRDPEPEPRPRGRARDLDRAGKTVAAGAIGALTTTMARTVGRELVRGLLGMLGAKPRRRTTRRSRW